MTVEQRAVRFAHADLAIEVKPESHAIEGVATLTFVPDRVLTGMALDLDRNLPISAIAVDGVAVDAKDWSNPEGRLTIKLPKPAMPRKPFTIRIAYGGQPHVAVKAPWDGGFVWSKTADGQPWIATAVEGEGCDLFWPCIDHPMGEPALVDLHITVPAALSAPANGVLIGVRDAGQGRRTWDWRVKHPNTYAIALDIGPFGLLHGFYNSRFGNRIPLQLWYLKGHEKQARGLYAEFGPTLDFFESMIGPYPFGDEKLGVVETPHKGMEHQTINAYGNDYAKDISGYDWLFQHEFSHEWFGNQLTNRSWDDYWLHEGYGSYMQPLYGQWRGGDYEYLGELRDQSKRMLNKHPIVTGHPLTEDDVYSEKTGPGIDIYMKASWMLHTLRGLIGDKAFFEVTRRIVYGRPDPRPGNFAPRYASTPDYIRIVDSVTRQKLDWFFDVYLRSAKLPELAQRRTGNRLDLWWRTPGGKPFPMPIEVQVGESITRVAMTGGKGSLVVPAGAHVVIDPMARVLRRSTDQEAYRVWQDAADAKKKAAKG
nr:M1 family aminopeptidase [Sphingomonas vulcanisoli]